uniref:BRCA-2_OB1 domain-containing protein n=1 Tax=Loa loa TaxID=7209 RepID=A0A1I7W0T7_LOALO
MQAILQAEEEYVELRRKTDGQALRQVPPLDRSKNWYCKKPKLLLKHNELYFIKRIVYLSNNNLSNNEELTLIGFSPADNLLFGETTRISELTYEIVSLSWTYSRKPGSKLSINGCLIRLPEVALCCWSNGNTIFNLKFFNMKFKCVQKTA